MGSLPWGGDICSQDVSSLGRGGSRRGPSLWETLSASGGLQGSMQERLAAMPCAAVHIGRGHQHGRLPGPIDTTGHVAIDLGGARTSVGKPQQRGGCVGCLQGWGAATLQTERAATQL